MSRSRLTADAFISQYGTFVFARTDSDSETARRLQLDRRTVKSKMAVPFLKQFRMAGW